ncbi:MAG: hypothetical protein C4K58_05505 [Flavobacteriaceae bacterium]|nr:MAG: hypothetical protein C4K58_05505 [Flavobacteriaceae bacterium]
MKKSFLKIQSSKILFCLLFSGALVSCIETKTIFNALKSGVPNAFDYTSGKEHFVSFPKSNTPFEFPKSQKVDFLKGRTLKIGNKPAQNLEAFLENSKALSFLVIQNDSIVFEKYYNGADQNTTSNVFSVSKSYVAFTLAIAVEKGYLKMDDKVLKFFPELSGKIHPNLTVKNLIDMRAEFDYDETPLGTLGRPMMILYSPDIDYQVLKGIKTLAEPDTYYHYNSNATHLTSMIIAKATGVPFTQFFKENLWDKLQMEHEGGWQTDEKGVAKGFCCFHLTALDEAKIGKVLLDKGVWRGEQLIPRWFVDQITTNNDWQSGYYYSLSVRNNTIKIPMELWDGKTPEGARKGVKGQEIIKDNKHYMSFPLEDSDFYLEGFMANNVYVHPRTKSIIVRMGSNAVDYYSTPWPLVYRAIALGQDSIPNEKLFVSSPHVPVVNGEPTLKKGYKLPD